MIASPTLYDSVVYAIDCCAGPLIRKSQTSRTDWGLL